MGEPGSGGGGKTIAKVPRWAIAALRFCALGTPGGAPLARRPKRSAVVALEGFPGGELRARRLARAGWVEVWDGLACGPLVTLSPLAAEAIGVSIDEAPRILHATEPHFAGRDRFGVEKPPQLVSVRLLDLDGRWYSPGERPPVRRMPKVRGFAPLPYAGRVAAPAEVDPNDAPRPPSIARLLLLGAIAEALKPRPRSKKSKKRK